MNYTDTSFFTMLWPNDYCRFLARAGLAGQGLRFVWGGHNINTRFSHYGVSAGDYMIPIRVYHQRVYVIASMKVKNATTRNEYLASHPLDELLVLHNCANEILEGVEGTPISFDVPVPAQELEHIRFIGRRGERGIKYVQEGKLVRSVSLEGVYRLAPSSAQLLMSLVKVGMSVCK